MSRTVSIVALVASITTLPTSAFAVTYSVGQQTGGIESYDYFGAATATGDFNCDGRDDLAIGAPGEDIGATVDAGYVNIRYGSATGLGTTLIGLQSPWAQAGEQFGQWLAVGDFDADGCDDLVVSVPLDAGVPGGSLHVYAGGEFGLIAGDPTHLWGNDFGAFVDASDWYGHAVAIGDFNGDGFDDLAAGLPSYYDDRGLVNLYYGTATGIDWAGGRMMTQSDAGGGASEVGDLFGHALASGDFNNDGFADLAIGVIGEETTGTVDTGYVHVVHGAASGLRVGTGYGMTSANLGIGLTASAAFGSALAAGDFNRDGRDDLAIGFGGWGKERVAVRFGAASGLLGTYTSFQQNSLGGAVEAGDEFGHVLTTGDINGDGYADLVVSARGEDASYANQGWVGVRLGAAGGFGSYKSFSTSNASGAAASDLLGGAVAAGDFNNDGRDDVAAGMTGRTTGAGAVMFANDYY